MAALDMVGTTFRVKEKSGYRNGKLRLVRKLWAVFTCACGNNFPAKVKDVQSGHTRSCGCLKLKHGNKRRQNSTPTYRTWCSMLQRCNNPKATSFYMYGAVGVSVCKEWHTFENFLTDMGPRPEGHSLDRVDSDGDYCKANCRWATPQDQADNRRCCRQLNINGVTLPISKWAAASGTSHETIASRYRKGWSPEEAVYGRNK